MEKITGQKPSKSVPLTEDFDELSRKRIDILVDSIKYIATTCGITVAIYSRILQEYLHSANIRSNIVAQILVSIPLILWFLAIAGTVIGIYPKKYKATTDYEKQVAMNKIYATKRFWLVFVLWLFLGGFFFFTLVISAQIWQVYPFKSDLNPLHIKDWSFV